MSEIVIYTIITVVAIGVLAAIVLYIAAQKFKVFEDPRIDEVEEILPAANCGGCGYPGCRNFAESCVKADELDALYCPVGGNDVMAEVAKALGKVAIAQAPKVAVVRCSGTAEHRPRTNTYNGASNCNVASALYSGDTGCQYGCLGHGDCEDVCDFNAIHINPATMLPEVIDDNCTACNACVVVCPKDIIELRPKQKKDRKIFVSCINEDKGGIAKKNCGVACTGCTKCVKECPHDAIVIKNFLAYIDADKCKLCRKCVIVCPTKAINEIGFPPRKERKPAPTKVSAATLKPQTAAKPNLAAEVKGAKPPKSDDKPAAEDNNTTNS